MGFLTNLLARFTTKPEPVAPSPLYTDAEFLEAVAALARERTRAEQLGQRPAPDAKPAGAGRAVA